MAQKVLKDGADPYSDANRYQDVRKEDWVYMIDHVWTDNDHRELSDKRKYARAHLPNNHTMGSRSFVAAISIKKMETGVKPHIVDFYELCHRKEQGKGDWIDPVCEKNHADMKRLREESSQPGAVPMSEEEILVQVLKKKSGSLRGYQFGPKPSSSKSASYRLQAEENQSLREHVKALKEKQRIQDKKNEVFEKFMMEFMNNLQPCSAEESSGIDDEGVNY